MKQSKDVKAFAFIVAFVLVIKMCSSSSDNTEEIKTVEPTTKTQQVSTDSNPKEEQVISQENRDIVVFFVKLNEKLLGDLKDLKEISKDNYQIAVEKSPFIFSLIIENGVVSYMNLIYKDLLDLPIGVNNDSTIDKKMYDYTMSQAPTYIDYHETNAKVEKQFNPFTNNHYNLVELVKKNLTDPSGYKPISTMRSFDEKTKLLKLTMTFKAKNSLGVLVDGTARATADVEGNILDYVID